MDDNAGLLRQLPLSSVKKGFMTFKYDSIAPDDTTTRVPGAVEGDE